MHPADGEIAPLVVVQKLSHRFVGSGGKSKHGVDVLQDVDLVLPRGQTVGLVGESGSGKTTLGRCILRLVRPTAGRVWFDGIDITALSRGRLRPLCRRMQMVVQDPLAALNPRLTVAATLNEPLRVHQLAHGPALHTQVQALLERVGLGRELGCRYPHELSSGQRQRLTIARALSVAPDLLVADEPTSALDVSVQAQIINLLAELKLSLTLLFISHDLHLVRLLADQVAVMHRGRIVEQGPTAQVLAHAAHLSTP